MVRYIYGPGCKDKTLIHATFLIFCYRLACHCIGTISRMSETQRESFMLRHVSLETHRTLSVQNSKSIPHDLPDVWTTEFTEEDCPSLRQTVNVCGVMLPIYDRKSQVTVMFLTHPVWTNFSLYFIFILPGLFCFSLCPSASFFFVLLEESLVSSFLSKQDDFTRISATDL